MGGPVVVKAHVSQQELEQCTSLAQLFLDKGFKLREGVLKGRIWIIKDSVKHGFYMTQEYFGE